MQVREACCPVRAWALSGGLCLVRPLEGLIAQPSACEGSIAEYGLKKHSVSSLTPSIPARVPWTTVLQWRECNETVEKRNKRN